MLNINTKIECDLKSHDSSYDSFKPMDMESVLSESISDDSNESLQSETDDTHFDVGEKLSQIRIELIRSQDDIDVMELNGLISSLNTRLNLKCGDESDGRKRHRHSFEDE